MRMNKIMKMITILTLLCLLPLSAIAESDNIIRNPGVTTYEPADKSQGQAISDMDTQSHTQEILAHPTTLPLTLLFIVVFCFMGAAYMFLLKSKKEEDERNA